MLVCDSLLLADSAGRPCCCDLLILMCSNFFIGTVTFSQMMYRRLSESWSSTASWNKVFSKMPSKHSFTNGCNSFSTVIRSSLAAQYLSHRLFFSRISLDLLRTVESHINSNRIKPKPKSCGQQRPRRFLCFAGPSIQSLGSVL